MEGRMALALMLVGCVSASADMPLVGLGVGNMPHGRIPSMIHEAVAIRGVRVIDTAAASRNEHLVATALKSALPPGETVHVVTKVWYTHLGFERTLLAVEDSLASLSPVGPLLRVTVLLHWPRCRKDIQWMDCEGEENRLPLKVKQAGPPPHRDPEGAWKDSWRALEQLHSQGRISGIGVSNFNVEDTDSLLALAKVPPCLAQVNLWSVLHDEKLLRLLRANNVTLQAYNAYNGVLSRRQAEAAPLAHRRLSDIAVEHSSALPTTVLAWLAREKVASVVRTTAAGHLGENAPAAVLEVAAGLTEEDVRQISSAVKQLMQGRDAQATHQTRRGVDVEFVNMASAGAMKVLWRNPKSKAEVEVAKVPAGGTSKIKSHRGHVFVARTEGDPTRRAFQFVVTADVGAEQTFILPGSAEEEL